MDRGIAGEDNLEWLRQRGAHYLVGTPKKHLKKYDLNRSQELPPLSTPDFRPEKTPLQVASVSPRMYGVTLCPSLPTTWAVGARHQGLRHT